MVENVGVPPDIDIMAHPGDVIKGIDSQLEKAVEQYKKFLNLRKNADPGMAEVEDARKRMAGLR